MVSITVEMAISFQLSVSQMSFLVIISEKTKYNVQLDLLNANVFSLAVTTPVLPNFPRYIIFKV